MTDNGKSQGLARLRSTFQEIDSLKERFSVADPLPPSSPLALDDQLWPRLPISEHVRQCLASAVDHFDLVRLTIDAERTFPTGLNGVLRGGLVASSLAYWLVAPEDRGIRQQRGLTFGDEWYCRRIQYQKGLLPDLDSDARSRSEKQLEMLNADKAAAGTMRTRQSQLQATGAIQWAAEQVFEEPHLVRAAILEWNRLGGDAHALGWQLMMQETEWAPRDDGGAGPQAVKITASLGNVFEPYLCAWHIFKAALSRFDELIEAGEAEVA